MTITITTTKTKIKGKYKLALRGIVRNFDFKDNIIILCAIKYKI
jgi:hypothetical protein